MSSQHHTVLTIEQVQDEERRYIEKIREKSGSTNASSNYVGLALSGGGIRSATFQLGILQGLATAHLFPLVDYISSVSGGGYTCGWLIKWLGTPHQYASILDQLSITRGSRSSPRIQWLRRYTNYLTPRVGIFSHDSFLFGTTYIHNLLFNLIVLVFAFSFILLLPRTFLGLIKRLTSYPNALAVVGGSMACGSAFLLLLRLLSDGKPSSPLEWRFHLSSTTTAALLMMLACPYSYGSLSVGLAVCSFVLVPVLSKSRRLPSAVTISELLAAIRTALKAAVATAVSTHFHHGFRPFISIIYQFLTKRLTQAILCGGLLLAVFVIIHASELFPVWPYAVIFGSLWALPLDDLFETQITSRTVRRRAIVIPAFISSFFITAYMFCRPDAPRFQKVWLRYEALSGNMERALSSPMIIGLSAVGAAVLLVIAFSREKLAATLANLVDIPWHRARSPLKHILAAFGITAVVVVCVLQYPAVIRFIIKMKENTDPGVAFLHVMSIIAPACAVLGTLCCSIALGLLGSLISAHKRERLMASYATMYQCIAVWIFAITTSVYAPALLYTITPIVFWCSLIAWILIGVFAASEALKSVSEKKTDKSISLTARAAAPYLFAIGFVIACAMWDSAIVKVAWSESMAEYFRASAISMEKLGALAYAVLFGIMAAFFAARFGLNSSSMHLFYQARLARAYLLEGLPGVSTSLPAADAKDTHLGPPTYLNNYTPEKGYVGPLPIFNAALNMTGSVDLAIPERKATNFIFTPLVSGFDVNTATAHLGPNEFEDEKTLSHERDLYRTAYARTSEFRYGGEKGIRLAMALSISGSAVGSNMGFLTCPRIRFTHTLFNMRLGWWLANPRFPGAWNRRIPRQRVRMLISELLGRTDDLGAYIHLSDGGHFENLGLYELVRRRCRVIIVSDASEERGDGLGCFARALERCRVDFGAEINISLDNVLSNAKGVSNAGVVFGTIDYGPDSEHGVLVYCRAAVTDMVPYDVWERRSEDGVFPNHPTSDQWFNESVFEAYRILGVRTAMQFSTLLGNCKNNDFIGQCEELAQKCATECS